MIVLENFGKGGWHFTCDLCGADFGLFDIKRVGAEACRNAGWVWNEHKNKLLCPKHIRTRTSKHEMKLIKMGLVKKQ